MTDQALNEVRTASLEIVCAVLGVGGFLSLAALFCALAA